MFADDLSAWTSSKNTKIINRQLQQILSQIETWMNTWRTKLSASKTVWTIFSKNNQCSPNQLILKYDSQPIKMDRNPKFLGVTLDPGLRFNEYAKSIRTRTSRRLNMLKRIKGKNWGASSQLIMTTYKTLIRPIIDYVPFINLLMAESNYLILEKVQRRAARSITYWPIKTRTSVIYEQINLEDIRTRSTKLTDNYITKTLRTNDLIRSLVETYNTAHQLNEGVWCKSTPRQTILGLLKNNPNLQCSPLLQPKQNSNPTSQ